MKIYIDPRVNIEYGAFYIYGLYRLFDKNNVKFDITYFKEIKGSSNFNFIIVYKNREEKYSIDYNDTSDINVPLYNWCDYYGKINFRRSHSFSNSDKKIIIIPPGFGINVWKLLPTFAACFINLMQINNAFRSKRYISGYVKQLRHLPVSYYTKDINKANYVFSFNTLWNSDEWIKNDDTVNRMRYNFYKSVTSFKDLITEVGFIYSTNKNENPLFQEYISNKWIAKKVYLDKTKKSAFVFNTPAWDLCHGWKLAEYLALGKAIISTPLVNELPFPLEHGKHIHFVSGSVEEISEAIELLIANPAYRQTLENGARQYYLTYVQPTACLSRLMRLVDQK